MPSYVEIPVLLGFEPSVIDSLGRKTSPLSHLESIVPLFNAEDHGVKLIVLRPPGVDLPRLDWRSGDPRNATEMQICKPEELRSRLNDYDKGRPVLVGWSPHEIPEADRFCDLIGKSKAMQSLFTVIRTLAANGSTATVLATGASGTGKELVARAVHGTSPRSTGPFIAVSLAEGSESLIESQLFGHKRGAFTGADKDHNGYIKEAEGGTLFFDEIGELPLSIQAKLLRFLQEREFRPMGGQLERADVRFIFATNKDLDALIKERKFRDDLFYRINVIELRVPLLRQRKDDIMLLADTFLRRFRETRDIEFTTEVAKRFREYDWPGNVRELEHAVERAVAVVGGAFITLEHLPAALQAYVPSKEALSRSRIWSIDLQPIFKNFTKNPPRELRESPVPFITDLLDRIRDHGHEEMRKAIERVMRGEGDYQPKGHSNGKLFQLVEEALPAEERISARLIRNLVEDEDDLRKTLASGSTGAQWDHFLSLVLRAIDHALRAVEGATGSWRDPFKQNREDLITFIDDFRKKNTLVHASEETTNTSADSEVRS